MSDQVGNQNVVFLTMRLMYISDYCDPGEEKQASGRCVQCLQGFYKDNDLGLFSMCMACPENYTTLSVGASKAIQCSISE